MLHIQIVLYNSIRFLEDLIKSLNIVNDPDEVIVHFLENSSEDSKGYLIKLNPSFKYTFENLNRNLGFGSGHNFLFNKYKKEYSDIFLILNPDTLTFYNFLDELNKFIKSIKNDWGIIELAQFPQEHPKDFDESLKTEWAHGATSVFKTDDFERVKGFDENIFLYCEDVDISWRIREIGKNIYFCPTSRIAHITQSLDEGKSNTTERVYSFAGGLYLRYKYFSEDEVEKYKKQIQGAGEDYKKAIKVFSEMKIKLSNEELKNYRSFTTPKVYPDTNYAKHLW